jgi:hypothetical protein
VKVEVKVRIRDHKIPPLRKNKMKRIGTKINRSEGIWERGMNMRNKALLHQVERQQPTVQALPFLKR